MIYIFLIIIIILLFPLPLKIKLVFNNNILKIFIFKKQIVIDKNKLKEKLNKKTNDKNKKDKNKKFNVKQLLNIKINNLCKIKLKIKFNIEFGLDDAAKTAMLYGLMNIFPPFIYNIISKFFKIKKFKFNIQPIYNNEIIHIEIHSIFFVNLAKVIYILLKIFNLNLKEKISMHSKIQRSDSIG